MALTNFSLPFGALTQPWSSTISPVQPIHQIASNTNNLLYSPADHQQPKNNISPPSTDSDYYKNNPYAPPQLQNQAQYQTHKFNDNSRSKGGNTYLPPIPPPGISRNTMYQQQQQHYSHLHTQQKQQENQVAQDGNIHLNKHHSTSESTLTNIYGETSSNHFSIDFSEKKLSQGLSQHSATQNQNRKSYITSSVTESVLFNSNQRQDQHQSTLSNKQNFVTKIEKSATSYGPVPSFISSSKIDESSIVEPKNYPERPPGFTRVQAGQGRRTQLHAVLDYDADNNDEDYYDTDDEGEGVNKDYQKSSIRTVTPIQGPIFLKNGTVPVVPLFSYPTVNNGTFVQIPIWWTALSVALGLNVRGDIIKGVPCVKRYHQLFCPTAGNSYPIDKIERFIDDNKALMRRMYGDFEMNLDQGSNKRRKRFIDEPSIFIPSSAFPAATGGDTGNHLEETGDSYFGKLRKKRQSNQSGTQNRNNNRPTNQNRANSSGKSGTARLDACESKIEIVTPYWASNSAGKIRAIVNTQHFEQAIHQEVCSKTQTSRCDGECGCEQKYKWHRLLAYDPDNDCKGIFMDWFLFPSCCVCRCNPL